jgi:hypothetical protein
MKKYKIGIAIEKKIMNVKANSLEEAKSKAWETLSREDKDTHIEMYEVLK